MHRGIGKSVVIACLWATASAASTSALAQTDDDKKRAGEAYTLGTKLALTKKWAEAAEQFALADSLAPNDTALDAALEASMRADDPVLGMNLAERAERAPSARALPAVAAVRRKFQGKVGLVEIPCVALSTPCKSALDGKSVSAARTWVAPGAHTVVFETEAGPKEVPFEIAAGSNRAVVPPPVETTPVVAPPPKAAPEVAPEEGGGVSGFWILLPAGATLAAAGLTAGFGATFLSSESDFLAAQGVAPAATQQELIDETEAWELRSNIMIGVTAGCAAVTAAVVVAVLATSGEAEPPRATFVVVPSSDGGATFGFGGRF